jgi:hypothetical protein
MNEVKRCPKCGGEMAEANRLVAATRVLSNVTLAKRGDIIGDRIIRSIENAHSNYHR